MSDPTIFLFADVLGGYGGIETYLDALARRLGADGWPVRIAVSHNSPAPFLDELEALGISVYRQRRVRGDRWQIRQRLLVRHVASQVRSGDWVFCVRQPMPQIYLMLVRAVHARGGKVAASWAFAPEFSPPPLGRLGRNYCRAISQTDAVISVAECTKGQFREVYNYTGDVKLVRYHNIEKFESTIPLVVNSPIRLGYMGRIDIHHKNLDTILEAFRILAYNRDDVVLNMYGGGKDVERFRVMVDEANLSHRVILHGQYDHRRDLAEIVATNHLFIYTSRFEGGPCLSLIELLQAGRYVVASPVGGIPDIYAGRPEIGDLVTPDDPVQIADALERAARRIESGEIDPGKIRAVYLEYYRESVAHTQFLSALGLGPQAEKLRASNRREARAMSLSN